jgi:Methyltransferase domain
MMVRLLRAFAADPVGVIRALPGQIRTQLDVPMPPESQSQYVVNKACDEDLHRLLGAAWPCPQRQYLDELMAEINALLAAKGLAYGRQTYGVYSDGDSSLCQAAWCTVLHTRPDVVIETGVARGVTSRIVLEALHQNDIGHLWSIDLPYPFDRRLHAQTGAAVTDNCRARWSYVQGSSRRRLRPLVAQVGHVEVFIHDSLHTARNTLFEMNQVASAMNPGGVMLIDDISTHKGFAIFAERYPGYQTIVCPSEDRKGLFGIAINNGSA